MTLGETMTEFDDIMDAAVARAGGAEALATRLPVPKSARDLRAVCDDRYLSLMSLRIFRAGLKHSLVDAKWPAFEEAFLGFHPARVAALDEAALDRLLSDRRLIRHGGKMAAVIRNAAAMAEVREHYGGFGAYLADWPSSDIVALWHDLGRRFSQMGGLSAPRFLRMAGKDSFVLTDDVCRALVHWRLADGAPKGKRAQREAQRVFNRLAEAGGRPLSQVSMILAISVP